MKSVSVSDELYDKLKDFVVDPFEDTLETVIERLADIANKAKDRWSLSDAGENADAPEKNTQVGAPEGFYRSKPLSEATTL